MRRHGRTGVLLVAMAGSLAVCGDDLPSGSGRGSSTGGAPTGTSSSTNMGATIDESSGSEITTTVGSPPEVVDIGQDVLQLRYDEPVMLTAVVLDPDDDVVRGELLGPEELVPYGEFTAHPSGRWRITVTWDEVRRRWPLSFSREVEIPFTARFFDAQGHEALAPHFVRAVCWGPADTACDGTCTSLLLSETHCGECDHSCIEGEGAATYGECENGVCRPWWGDCFVPEPESGPQTCAEQCAAQGAGCVVNGCEDSNIPGTIRVHASRNACHLAVSGESFPYTCEQDFEALDPGAVARCCCL